MSDDEKRFKMLQRVARQMELYGLTPLQIEVVVNLFHEYVIQSVIDAQEQVAAEFLLEQFHSDWKN